MSTVGIRHEESWSVRIDREEGDDWPVQESGVHKSPHGWRPTQIRFTMHRGHEHCVVTLAGVKYKQDGTPGQVEARNTWYSKKAWPAWIEELVTKARETNGLRPAETGVDW